MKKILYDFASPRFTIFFAVVFVFFFVAVALKNGVVTKEMFGVAKYVLIAYIWFVFIIRKYQKYYDKQAH